MSQKPVHKLVHGAINAINLPNLPHDTIQAQAIFCLYTTQTANMSGPRDKMRSEVRIENLRFRLPADWELHDCTVIAFPDRRHTRFQARFLPSFSNLREEIILLFKHISLYEKTKIFGSRKILFQQKELSEKTAAHSRRDQKRVDFSDPHRNGINMDIRYGSPVVATEIVMRNTSEPERIVITTNQEAGTANTKRGQRERQCISFNKEYLRKVIEKGDERRFISPTVSWDASAFVHDGSGTFILSTALLRMRPQGHAPADGAAAMIQANMHRYMGAREFIWINQDPDFEDRPLSSMVRFVRPGHVLVSQPPEDDLACPWIDFYDVLFTTLHKFIDPYDNKYRKITRVEEAHPSRIGGSRGRRITRCGPERWPLLSYLTYIHVKDGILVPVFCDGDTDQRAKATIQSAFGSKCRFVDSVRVHQLPWWGSSLHSVTQHVPFDPVAERHKQEFARVVRNLEQHYLRKPRATELEEKGIGRRSSARQEEPSEGRLSANEDVHQPSEDEDYHTGDEVNL